MTECIILNLADRNFILNFKISWQSYLDANYVDFIILELLDGNYCTPSSLLTDPTFAPLVADLRSQGYLNDLTIREVAQSELKPIPDDHQ